MKFGLRECEVTGLVDWWSSNTYGVCFRIKWFFSVLVKYAACYSPKRYQSIGICMQCPKLRVHPAPEVHDFTVGCIGI